MKNKYMKIVIALLIAFISSGFIISKANSGPDIVYKEVLVATDDIRINEVLTTENTKVIKVPESSIISTAFNSLPETKYKAKQEIFKGEVIIPNSLTEQDYFKDENNRSYPVAINLSKIGILKPGDIVDIYVVLVEDKNAISNRILEKIEVLKVLDASGIDMEKLSDKSKYAPAVIELVLNEEQINIVNIAETMGELKVVRHF